MFERKTMGGLRLMCRTIVTMIGCAIIPSPLLAQDAEPEPLAEAEILPTIPVNSLQEPEPLSEESDAPEVIEEITVTATKREQSIREIPASVSAVSGEDLEQQGVQGVEDLSRLVPGVSVTTPGEGNMRVTVRGIAALPGTNLTTGVLYGDVSFNDSYLPSVTLDPNPFDLKSVEVLKGPQGTLFGAGALNGAVRYVPEPPKLGEWETRWFVQYTAVDHGDDAPIYGAAVNVPIVGDTAALRVMAFDRRSPGYIDNTQIERDANDIEQQGVRAILAWNPDEEWDTALTYAYQLSDTGDAMVADNLDGDLKTDNRPRLSTVNVEYHFVDLTVKRHFDWADLVSDSAFVTKENAGFFDASSRLPGNGQTPILLAQPNTGASDTWSQEFRLVSQNDADSPWTWVGGVFGFRQKIDFTTGIAASTSLPGGLAALPPALGAQLDALLPGVLGAVNPQGEAVLADLAGNVEIDELALFGEVMRRLGEDWELTLGGRLYRTQSGGTVNQSGLLLAAANLDPESSINATVKEQGFNPKASLLWRPNDVLTVYTAASEGFRVGGVQPGFQAAASGQPAPDTFKSDTIWNYEAGVRTTSFGGALHFDVTAYYSDWKNPQTFQLGANGLTSFIDNAGGVESKGVEMAVQARLPYGLLLGFAGSRSETVTTKPFTAQDGSIVAPGQAWPFAPKEQIATSLGQLAVLGNWEITSTINYTWLGKARSSLEDAQALEIFDFHQTDLRFALSNPRMRWLPEITFTANNLSDERGVTNHFRGPTYDDVSYIRPRAYTLRLSSSF